MNLPKSGEEAGLSPPPPILIPTPLSAETLEVFFAKGSRSVTTSQEYAGPTSITVNGAAIAPQGSLVDAFYRFSPTGASPVQQTNLWIDSQPGDKFIKSIPAFNGDHQYVFTINAPGGPLTFGVGKGLGTTGFFTVTVLRLDIIPSSPIPSGPQ